jgi:hypothetical protein
MFMPVSSFYLHRKLGKEIEMRRSLDKSKNEHPVRKWARFLNNISPNGPGGSISAKSKTGAR